VLYQQIHYLLAIFSLSLEGFEVCSLLTLDGLGDVASVSDVTSENKGGDSRKLNQNVDGGAGGILERITNGVTDDGASVLLLERSHEEQPLVLNALEVRLLDLVVLLDAVVDEVLLAILGSLSVLIPVLLAPAVEDSSLSLDFLLGVIPSTTSVGGGDGNLDTRDDGTGKDTLDAVLSEEDTSDDGNTDDKKARGDHVLEGGLGGNLDALGVVRVSDLLTRSSIGLELFDLSHVFHDDRHHLLSGLADGDHGHGGEPVREHSTDEQTRELDGLEDVDGSLLNTGDESTEESETNKAGRANGETLANSGSGVTGGIEGISSVSDNLGEGGHLSETTGVVGDGTVAINGEGDGKGAEHTEGREADTVHTSGGEGVGNGGSDAENGDNARGIAESETVDDVGGGTLSAGSVESESGAPDVGSVVLSNVTDDHAGPETAEDAAEGQPSGGIDVALGNTLRGRSSESEGIGKGEHGGDEEGSHDDGGDKELGLEDALDGLRSDHEHVGEKNRDGGSNDTNGGDDKREVEGIGRSDELDGGGGNDESSAGGLSEGTEKIGTHTSDITNIVTDVIGNGTRVLSRVLFETLDNLTNEISTDIGSLGVDTTTDSTEESDSGATETVASNEFEKSSDEILDSVFSISNGLTGSLNSSIDVLVEPDGLIDEDDDLEEKESNTDEAETEDLTALESSHETFLKVLDLSGLLFTRRLTVNSGLRRGLLDVVEGDEHVEVALTRLLVGDGGIEHLTLAALVGGSGVGVRGNGHADPAGEDGRESTNEESNGSVGEVGGRPRRLLTVHLSSVDGETNKDGKHGAEEDQVSVLSQEEVVGTVGDQLVDLLELIDTPLSLTFGSHRRAVFVHLFIIDSTTVLSCGFLFFFEEFFHGLQIIDIDCADEEDIDCTPNDRGEGAANDEIVGPVGNEVFIVRT
jgi:hypothetical protein